MQLTPASAELVRVTSLSQDLTVGVGLALASVRTLTDVSLVVHARELVVLSGNRGAGERALLAVIAGDRRGVTGTCDVDLHTRVRLMRIGAPAAAALAQEWPRATHISQSITAHASTLDKPELFLLDVVNDDTRDRAPRAWSENNRATLLAWAALCQSRGGAVVMAAGQALGEGLFTSALSRSATPHNVHPFKHASREGRPLPASRASVFERRVPSGESVTTPVSPVRVVVMHCGRMAPSIQLDACDLNTRDRAG